MALRYALLFVVLAVAFGAALRAASNPWLVVNDPARGPVFLSQLRPPEQLAASRRSARSSRRFSPS